MAVRFLNLLMSSVFKINLYLPAAALMFVFALALVAKFQPHKCKRNNTVDIISSSMYCAGGLMYPKWLSMITIFISVLILLCYLVFLILARVLPKTVQCFKKFKTFLMSIIQASEVNMEDRALLKYGSANYNAYRS